MNPEVDDDHKREDVDGVVAAPWIRHRVRAKEPHGPSDQPSDLYPESKRGSRPRHGSSDVTQYLKDDVDGQEKDNYIV